MLDRAVKSATHPIAPPWSVLAALLLLAGISPPRRHALPAHPMTAHSDASNHRFP
ncbi:MAG TPA: hypothetical protein VE934_07360 [Polaromonas sp.]|uniref:hypothetical protein n=1 Tax=Polaromonas sp. TaxID=1869339 RepID=UPI002D291E1C|nr:hypothetical protein [Polaromonas sp.]HYW56760.1 hypothetical protein [Polaromonas sp.]